MENKGTCGGSVFSAVYFIVQVLFVVFKLLGRLDWTWLQVFIPSIIYFGIGLVALVVGGLVVLISYVKIRRGKQ